MEDRGLTSKEIPELKLFDLWDLTEAIEPLWMLYLEYSGGAPEGFAGRHATWESIQAWARLTKRRLNPDEVKALIIVDAIIRNPPDISEVIGKEEKETDGHRNAWPTNRR